MKTTTRPDCFLIVGNGRSGSTWLTSALNQLPDVSADLELCWQPWFRTFTAAHRVIASWRVSVRALIENSVGTGNEEIVGSKLVLSAKLYGPIEIRDVVLAVDREVRIIHLTRTPAEVLVSYIKSQGQNLQRDKATDRNYLVQTLERESTAAPPKPSHTFNKYHAAFMLLAIRRNNSFLKIFQRTHPHYLRVDYSEVAERWDEICNFVNTQATAEQRSHALNDGPIAKNLALDLGDRIANAAEIHQVIEIFGEGSALQCLARAIGRLKFRFPGFLFGALYFALERLKSRLNVRQRLSLLFG